MYVCIMNTVLFIYSVSTMSPISEKRRLTIKITHIHTHAYFTGNNTVTSKDFPELEDLKITDAPQPPFFALSALLLFSVS